MTIPNEQTAPERIWIGRASLEIAGRSGTGDFYLKKIDGLIDVEYARVTPPVTDEVEVAREVAERVVEISVADYVNDMDGTKERIAAIIASALHSTRQVEQAGLSLFSQLVSGRNALRDLDVFACNSGEHEAGCECFWEQCEAWAKSVKGSQEF